jgi:hypothetical protein
MSFDSFLFPPLFANYDAFMSMYEEPIGSMQPNVEEAPAIDSRPLHEMISHIEDLAQPMMAEATKRTADEVGQPDQLAKRRNFSIFTEGKGAGLSPRAILATLGEGTGFTETQIQSRCSYLAVTHPELQAVLKTKKVKIIELTETDEKLVRYRLGGLIFTKIREKFPGKTFNQLRYRWSQLKKYAPEFIQSVKEQMAKENQERLVAKLTNEGYSLMQIAHMLTPQQQPN